MSNALPKIHERTGLGLVFCSESRIADSAQSLMAPGGGRVLDWLRDERACCAPVGRNFDGGRPRAERRAGLRQRCRRMLRNEHIGRKLLLRHE